MPTGVWCTGSDAFAVPTGITFTSVGVRVGGAEIDGSATTDQATWTVP